MSFVNLATLTMHRRSEMKSRIDIFDEKCDRAIEDIKKLKTQAQGFVSQLDCDPAELKDRFLNFMKKLDEYTYLITDFNLALGQLEDTGSVELTPVQDNAVQALPMYNYTANNLLDALSEPGPATSCACINQCPPEKPKRRELKENQLLIAFSSSSSESLLYRKSDMVAKEVQCSLAQDLETVGLEEPASPQSPESVLPPQSPEPVLPSQSPEPVLPPQCALEVDRYYPGIMTVITGAYFWVITEDSQEFYNFMHEITEYYQKNDAPLTKQQANTLTYCAFYEESTQFYYRGLSIKEEKDDSDQISLFLVDTGEIRLCPVECLRRLAPQFAQRAPFARYCHLAGVDLMLYKDKRLMQRYERFMEEYLNEPCSFLVDEDSSESLGVYVKLASGEILNQILVQRGLAKSIDKVLTEEAASHKALPTSSHETPHSARALSPLLIVGPPDHLSSDHDSIGPEYDDPVEAVTGYHNRDEADICKHYKGGPDKTCFKGSRCTKKHIMKHPDGWTLDRVEVVGKCKETPLPAPNTWLKVLITSVCHYDRVYVNIVNDDNQIDEVPDFGIVLPPTTLKALVRDMNSAATRISYQPLQFTPAPGEMVAAVYPPDNQWYRARVITITRADQSVEVIYVDYGTVMWIREDQIRELEPRFVTLPTQAVRCMLAGVHEKTQSSRDWARAKQALADLILDATLHCHVIAREYDEIIVELVDDEGYNVADKLASAVPALIEVTEYAVRNDENVRIKVVVP